MTDNMLYPNFTSQCFILVKNQTFPTDLIGILTKASSIIKSNTLQIKPAKLGIRYTSSMKYPTSNNEELNIPRQTNPIIKTIGLNHRSLEEIEDRVSSIICNSTQFNQLWCAQQSVGCAIAKKLNE
jgi:hypothetical protein